ncbi:galactosyltransferase-related protein [Roseiconus lacunae]|uniref:Galactosyltransferase-related protein n=1 Tax=Roseiconus lacunae TaxID=2605694 RepID=A0ABT7PPM7_9BACT|nr:galactosyltransferase-related protein [Roseiconus lacunae]MDM4018462.1 galactosyltransferase-related protein [Roseiconus lacunae]
MTSTDSDIAVTAQHHEQLMTSTPPNGLRQRLGCWLHERWRAEVILRAPHLAARLGWTWMDLHNRREHLTRLPDSEIRICQWQDSSKLTIPRVFPRVASRLLEHCLKLNPISLQTSARKPGSNLEASVLIAIGGDDRLPLLSMVLRSLLSQVRAGIEIVVCESGPTASLRNSLPECIRYCHLPRDATDGFNKSRALNRAAELARGRVLFIHDADYLVPQNYLAETLGLLGDADGIRPCRLLFHASRSMTDQIIQRQSLSTCLELEAIVENNPTPIAVTANAYQRIGGHDEDYSGWGGEDTEFLSRLRTGHVIEGGTSFGIHLWHPPAQKKVSGHRNRSLHERKMRRSAETRIHELRTTGQFAAKESQKITRLERYESSNEVVVSGL